MTNFSPDVVANNDYYPGGMLVPNRHASSAGYRYGFQGQEKDDELKGEGNSYAYTFRFHDPRIGRFFAIDPLTSDYPWYTPYSFSGNKVIAFTELEGLEEKSAIRKDVKIKSELKPTMARDNIPAEQTRKVMNYISLKGVGSESFSSKLARLDKYLKGSGETSFGKWLNGKGETIDYDGYNLFTDNSKPRSGNDGKIGPQATSGEVASANVTNLWQAVDSTKPGANQKTKFKGGDGRTGATLPNKQKNLVTEYNAGKIAVTNSDAYKVFSNLGNNPLTFVEKVSGDIYRLTIDTITKNGQEFTVITSEGIKIDTLANGGILHTTIRDVKSFTAISLREKDSIIKVETSKLAKADSTAIENTRNENTKKKI